LDYIKVKETIMERLSFTEIQEKYQHMGYDKYDINALLKQEIAENNIKFVVLDDDPTGVQTVHGVHVYTDWSYESILLGFQEEERLFYILTNSRALTQEQTTRVHREIAQNIIKASMETGKRFHIR
jgi:hypothetical protein